MKKRLSFELLYRVAVFVALLIFLQLYRKYHFFFIEQWNLFLWSKAYLTETICQTGGLSEYLGSFLLQWMGIPWLGAAISAALLTASIFLTRRTLQRLNGASCIFAEWLPAVCLLLSLLDFNFLWQGAVGFLMVQGFYFLYLRFESSRWLQCALGWGGLLFTFFAAGSVSLLLFIALWIHEWFRCNRSLWNLILLPIATAALCTWAVVGGEVASWRDILTPEMYHSATAHIDLYLPWIIWTAVILGSHLLLRFPVGLKRRPKHLFLSAIQVAAILLIGYLGCGKYGDSRSYKMKELDHYTRIQAWDTIIERCSGKQGNFLNMNYLNMALGQKGVLAERLFHYDQRPGMSLSVTWDRTPHVAVLLNEINFYMGHVSRSQRMAFEAFVCRRSPRLLQRLVQTNLIYGEYAVAEKYIEILEQTALYRGWAKRHRHFLNNDAAVEGDLLLGRMRRGLPVSSEIFSLDEEWELESVARANPQNRLPIEYLGCKYLIDREMEKFKLLIDTYYGTPVLPELPDSFREAVIIYAVGDLQYCLSHGVDISLIKRFDAFRTEVQKAHRLNTITPSLRTGYGHTFWFYYMFKTRQ